jgi:hypothetical protein
LLNESAGLIHETASFQKAPASDKTHGEQPSQMLIVESNYEAGGNNNDEVAENLVKQLEGGVGGQTQI